ncbi:MAG: aminotransferase class III-fold pyridoxal phosphate-dependent enzyme [Methanobacteriaceae archaeon]|nr:aminotransferase class III-fold pyridoxal phosphate-dependent enzyme [Methanobacteriaceae archaeon]
MALKDWSDDLKSNGVPFIYCAPPGPKSRDNILEAKKYVTSYWAGQGKSGNGWDLPLTVKRVANSLIEDVDGNVYIDLNSGISTANFGYNNPFIWSRAQKIMEEYGILGIFPSNDYNLPLMTAASKKILSTVPNGHRYRVHYACDGTEANEAALKTAISYTGRSCVVSFMGSFLGRTMGSLSCMAQKSRDADTFRSLRSSNIYFAEGANCPNCLFCDSPDSCNGYCIEKFLKDRVLTFQVSPEEVAAFIMEPYITGGLMNPAPQEFLKCAREICDQYGIVLIFDEVQSGMGRSGRMWVHEHHGIEPDIFTSAKSLGGGISPLSAAFIKEEIMEEVPAYHGSTYGGAPISLAGNMAAMEYMDQNKLLERVNKLGKIIENRFLEWTDYSNVWQTRGWGLLKAVDFREDKNKPLVDYKNKIQGELFKKGVITMSGGQGRYLSMLRIIPSFTIPLDQLSIGLDIFEEIISKN